MNIPDAINSLKSQATAELAARYEELFGKPPRTRNAAWLRKRIAYRLQENEFGGLSRTALAAIDRLTAEVRLPAGSATRPSRPDVAACSTLMPTPGSVLQREWRGQQIRVEALEDGFVWNDTRYSSLSALAFAITGTKWNGRLFFGLTKRGKA